MTNNNDNFSDVVDGFKQLVSTDSEVVEKGREMLSERFDPEQVDLILTKTLEEWEKETAPIIEALENLENADDTEATAKEVFRVLGNSPLVLSSMMDAGVLFVPGTMKIIEITEDNQGVRIVDIVSAASRDDDMDPVQVIPIHKDEIDAVCNKLQELKAQLSDEPIEEAMAEETQAFFRDLGLEL